EYENCFESMTGLVYPDFPRLTNWQMAAPPGRLWGGIDFGFRNPFAAVWGPVRDDVLYLENEIYLRETPLAGIVGKLPRDVTWAADPAGKQETEMLRLAGLKVIPGKNDIKGGDCVRDGARAVGETQGQPVPLPEPDCGVEAVPLPVGDGAEARRREAD